jgi:hypothetical protein
VFSTTVNPTYSSAFQDPTSLPDCHLQELHSMTYRIGHDTLGMILQLQPTYYLVFRNLDEDEEEDDNGSSLVGHRCKGYLSETERALAKIRPNKLFYVNI